MNRKKIYIIYNSIILIFTIYVILDTFIIKKSYSDKISLDTSTLNIEKGSVMSNDNYYKDDNLEITLNEDRVNDTTVYIAYVKTDNKEFLKTAFASNTYGRNIKDYTTSIASNVYAILAINGDFYGAQEKGFVLKNGVIYRNISKGNEDLVIYKDGSWKFINEDDADINKLLNDGAYNILSFGPALIKNGSISVSKTQEVDKAMVNNPRTAIGIMEDGTYVFLVSDGRTNESEGLTLYEVASYMKSIGCINAYNLDGGGSSTMYFNGKLINKPTTNGRISERKVSDIVYVGY